MNNESFNLRIYQNCRRDYTPRNVVEGGYTGISLSVRLSVCLSVCPLAKSCPEISSVTTGRILFKFGTGVP